MRGERDILQFSGAFDPTAVRNALAGIDDVEVVSADADGLIVATEGASRKLPSIFGALSSTGSDVRETTLKQPSLETLFIKLTGRELRK